MVFIEFAKFGYSSRSRGEQQEFCLSLCCNLGTFGTWNPMSSKIVQLRCWLFSVLPFPSEHWSTRERNPVMFELCKSLCCYLGISCTLNPDCASKIIAKFWSFISFPLRAQTNSTDKPLRGNLRSYLTLFCCNLGTFCNLNPIHTRITKFLVLPFPSPPFPLNTGEWQKTGHVWALGRSEHLLPP